MIFNNRVNPVNPVKKTTRQGFTIVELLVAMSLLVILLGLSGMVFNTTVAAHRAAGATIDVSRKLRAVTEQLNTDFRGLRKEGEFFLVWKVDPERDESNVIIDVDADGIPDNYLKYDRIAFFADGIFQTYRPQQTTTVGVTKQVAGNLARVTYMLAKKADGTKPESISNWKRRILSRTEHIVTADNDLPLFPEPANLIPANWDPVAFEVANFYTHGYQTVSMADWTNMSASTSPYVAAKNNILTILSDISNILVVDNTVTSGGPTVEIGEPSTYHNLFSEGIRDLGIQIWLENEKRWFPQIDPNHDGDYSDTDYILDGSVIHQTQVDGILYDGTGESNLKTNLGRPLKFTALKFTFTLFDSNGVFADGKTFTHIVYLDN